MSHLNHGLIHGWQTRFFSCPYCPDSSGAHQSPVKCIPRVKPWGMKLIVQFRTAVKNVQSCSVMTWRETALYGSHFGVFTQWRSIQLPSSCWLHLAEVDADVVGSWPVCWLYRQVEAILTSQSCGRWQRGIWLIACDQALGDPRTALLHVQ
jgi:hypothetical protein